MGRDATKTAILEGYKFIHINTVAPFGTFRTKIRNGITSEKHGITLLRTIAM